jgi:hypothetical protein
MNRTSNKLFDRTPNELLIDRATHGGKAITEAELDALWCVANDALHHGPYHRAFAAVEALLVQADCHQNVCPDLLPTMQPTCRGDRTDEMVQGLVDRLESLNWAIRHR